MYKTNPKLKQTQVSTNYSHTYVSHNLVLNLISHCLLVLFPIGHCWSWLCWLDLQLEEPDKISVSFLPPANQPGSEHPAPERWLSPRRDTRRWGPGSDPTQIRQPYLHVLPGDLLDHVSNTVTQPPRNLLPHPSLHNITPNLHLLWVYLDTLATVKHW